MGAILFWVPGPAFALAGYGPAGKPVNDGK